MVNKSASGEIIFGYKEKSQTHTMCHITIGLGQFRFLMKDMISSSSLHMVKSYNSTLMHILISLEVIDIQKLFSE
jgi:hypothetical protein